MAERSNASFGNGTTRPNSQGDNMTPNQGQGSLIGLLTIIDSQLAQKSVGTSRPSFRGRMLDYFIM